MCGRVTLTTPDLEAVAALLEARVAPEHVRLYRPRYNAAPTDAHWVVEPRAEAPALVPAIWGFAGGAINARAETWERRFRGGRPVIVPADGFFEWTGPKGARRPLWFRPRAGGLLCLAGLAETLLDGRLAFVVLTTEASGAVALIHDRMPVLLSRENARAWLEQGDSGLLLPAPDDFLIATEVSPRVNDVRNDDPAVLEPPAADAPRQLGLF